ncbi:MAG: group II intron reverse transcriptase/maturase [Acidobacteria bacterium]|nr:MAG: group II intron reverse transcriptase/maturase [Acidobacteriota bacterium]
MASDRARIGEKARQEPKLCFTSLYHHVTDLDNLRADFKGMEPGKAPGIDGVTKTSYGENLEAHLADLTDRLKRLGYRPQPARRKWIPKPGSRKQRPLGILCFEDQLVHTALKETLEPIYEADFLDCSYGYRPKRTAHQLLDALGRTIQQKPVRWVYEADITGFFDHVHHEWMLEFLRVRIGDERVLRIIYRILKSGVLDGELQEAGEEGTPQGAVLSPLLANIYLHYALDLWFQKVFCASCRGQAWLFRFADDFVVCFEDQEDAERFSLEVKERLGRFNLTLAEDKTRLLRFGRWAEADGRRNGRRPETFDFLGFTHYCGKTRKGDFKVKRRTSHKRLRTKLAAWKEWVRKGRSRFGRGEILRRAKVKLQGALNYYAITDNTQMCRHYREEVESLLFKWLNRRSQRRSYTWAQFRDALRWVRWPRVVIKHDLNPLWGRL